MEINTQIRKDIYQDIFDKPQISEWDIFTNGVNIPDSVDLEMLGMLEYKLDLEYEIKDAKFN